MEIEATIHENKSVNNMDNTSLMYHNGTKRREYWEGKVKSIYSMPFEVLDDLSKWNDIKENEEIAVAGRILSKKSIGAVTFFNIFDHSVPCTKVTHSDGVLKGPIQLILKSTIDDYSQIVKHLTYGDLVAAKGIVTYSNTGERSIEVHGIQLISCNYKQAAEKYHGIVNEDLRLRNTYMVYGSNIEFQKTINTRFKLMQIIREYFYSKEFLEVETPILQKVASGAAARPFLTHHNALDVNLYLRIAPELKLKTLIAAGYTKIFEVGKNFRNEGIDTTHLQEFTMLECYAAYWTYKKYMDFTRELFSFIRDKLNLPKIITFRNHEINLDGEWKIENFTKIILKETGIDIEQQENLKERIIEYLKNNNQDYRAMAQVNSYMGMVDFIYKKICRPKIIQPTFMIGYPSYMAPLATVEDGYSTKMQLVIAGIEFVNCYTELVDPIKQDENFKEQEEYQRINNIKDLKNSDEAEDLFRRDQEFMDAMEYGMPPMSGYGLGIDRLVCLFTGKENLKNTIMFPLVLDK